jgi:hypothetical protein
VAPSGHVRRRSRRQTIGALVTLTLVVGLVPLAYARPPDPLWIRGIYDAADFDDVVALLLDLRMEGASPPAPRAGCLIFMAQAPLPVASRPLPVCSSTPRPRAPPLG